MFSSLLPRAAVALTLLLAGPTVQPAAAQATTTQTAHPAFTVQVVGKGRPVILIPGLTCPGAVWADAVARYQKQYQCHVVSLAGFGGVAAQQPVSAHLLQDVRDQLLAYIKAQKLTKPTVVGHSLGGFLALWMASTDPAALGPLEIVDSLPFMSAIQMPTATVESARPMAEQLRKQVARGHLTLAAERQMVTPLVTDSARITQVARWGLASDPSTVAQAMYDMYTTDLRTDISRIKQPVLVLSSWAGYKAYGATKASTLAIYTQQYAQLPQARIEMSEAGRHFLMYDDPQWFFTQTDAFLQQPATAKR
ncbi:alpha/beta hydrolase [Hymenobacter setariae]|uniref:Alpha/beta hydrolase n=1 Tax=Hymenobacter setariae TaxID=2594794 RepID=A0A558BSH0_9BACT|nr:alpha/beta hydrolase [Hymenobacter setariae]TVT39464.1 alpha/beta hydrolase [Hymenobacter setariae]